MKILELVQNLLSEEFHIDKLKEKFVNSGKISDNLFNEIINVSKNKIAYITWLTINVVKKLILDEDVYKFKEYFEIFEKHKQKFIIKDIAQYKTSQDINEFIIKCIEIREKNLRFDNIPKESSDNYVSNSGIEKLESVGIKYLGMSDGYQVFEIPNEVKNNENTWKYYRDILGRCSGRKSGESIDICTIASYSAFKKYLNDHSGSSYFIIFNMGDPKSPYQFHFESRQFMDKNDQPLFQSYGRI